MTRVPPIVFVVGALVALVVALVGLVLGWPEVTPVAFFAFVFCTILATMGIALATMERYAPPVVETVPHTVTHTHSEEQDQDVVSDAPRHMEALVIVHDDTTQTTNVADDEQPQRPA